MTLHALEHFLRHLGYTPLDLNLWWLCVMHNKLWWIHFALKTFFLCWLSWWHSNHVSNITKQFFFPTHIYWTTIYIVYALLQTCVRRISWVFPHNNHYAKILIKTIMRKICFRWRHENYENYKTCSPHMYSRYTRSICVLHDQVSHMYYKALVSHVYYRIRFQNMALHFNTREIWY